MMKLILTEQEMQNDLAKKLALLLQENYLIIYLDGQIGTGKTSLVRAILNQYSYKGIVNSPSFNLVNIYELKKTLIHCDLYRFEQFNAPEMLMLDDYFGEANYLIEWPYNAQHNAIPAADIVIKINNISNNIYSREYYITINNNALRNLL